jgi:ATP-binding cassette subfamily B protein
VQEALGRAASGRSVLVVAHRLSTVRGADVVAVVQGGRVAESGTHAQLLAAGGAYQALVRRQLLMGDGDDGGGGAGGGDAGGQDAEQGAAVADGA